MALETRSCCSSMAGLRTGESRFVQTSGETTAARSDSTRGRLSVWPSLSAMPAPALGLRVHQAAKFRRSAAEGPCSRARHTGRLNPQMPCCESLSGIEIHQFGLSAGEFVQPSGHTTAGQAAVKQRADGATGPLTKPLCELRWQVHLQVEPRRMAGSKCDSRSDPLEPVTRPRLPRSRLPGTETGETWPVVRHGGRSRDWGPGRPISETRFASQTEIPLGDRCPGKQC